MCKHKKTQYVCRYLSNMSSEHSCLLWKCAFCARMSVFVLEAGYIHAVYTVSTQTCVWSRSPPRATSSYKVAASLNEAFQSCSTLVNISEHLLLIPLPAFFYFDCLLPPQSPACSLLKFVTPAFVGVLSHLPYLLQLNRTSLFSLLLQFFRLVWM